MVLNFLFLPPTSETACIWWNCAIVFSVNTAYIWNTHDVGRMWANTPNTLYRTRNGCLHMTIIRMWLHLQAIVYEKKVQTQTPYRNCESGNSSVKQSNWYSHSLSVWMCCTLAAHHVLCRTHGIWCSPHWDGMDRISQSRLGLTRQIKSRLYTAWDLHNVNYTFSL